jgi:phosphoheptose isomerase
VAAVYEEVLAAGATAVRDDSESLGTIDRGFDRVLEVLQESRRRRLFLVEAVETMAACFAGGGKVLVCGDGGSAAQAQHFAADLAGRVQACERPGLPVLALNADAAALNSWSSDGCHDQVFARQAETFGRPGDVLLGISTSGCPRNVLEAFEAARRRQLRCVALLGGDGGELRDLADVALVVPSLEPPHVREAHTVLLNLLGTLVEDRLSTRPGPGAAAAGIGPGAQPAAP